MAGRTEWWALRLAALVLPILVCSCSSQRSAEEAYRRAWSAYTSGNLPSAAEQASLNAGRFQKDPASFWKFRLLEAEVRTAQGKAKDADALLKDPIPSRPELSQLEIRRLIDQAALKAGRREEAAAALDRARSAVKDPELAIRIKLVEGLIALNQGQAGPAETAFRAAADSAVQQKFLYWQAQALSNLSYANKAQRRYEESVEAGLRALEVAAQAGARRITAMAHGNLGSTYSYLGDFDAALEHEEQATKLLEEIGDRSNLMIGLGELGLMYDRQGESQKAIANYERAYHIAKELDRKRDAERNAENLSLALIKMRQWDAAADWNQRASELVPLTDDKEAPPHLTRNRARIAYGRGDPEQAARICEDLLRAKAVQPDLRWDLYALLGSIDADAKRFQKANQEFEKALGIIDGTRSDLLNSHYRITLLSRLIPFYQTYVEALVRQNDDAGALRVIESSRARVLAERLGREWKPGRIANLSALSSASKASLLSFWLAPGRSYAWLITGKGVRRFNLPPAGEIEALVSSYRDVVEHSLKDPIATGDPLGWKLWDLLIAEIAPHILRNSRVIVIPDGALHRLNLETLVASQQKHYWIEDVELAVAPSISIAASSPGSAPARNRSLLLIGAPEYAGTRYQPLKNAASELRDVQGRFPGAAQVVYAGAQATPAAYRQSEPARFSIIHFAAHAEANREKPLESAVILSRQGDRYKLYAREVIDLPLKAELVTISACRSAGVRSYAGEGLIGFAWAFLQAGARAVVAGLWDVSDSSSKPLMDQFYTGIASGQSPVTAMRKAKLALLRSDPHYSKPFYWAPFQVYIASARQ